MADITSLRTLTGAYLNQDWAEEYDSVDEAVRDFVANEPPALVDAARAQLETLLAAPHDEQELSEILLRDLWSGYWPPGEGRTVRAWFEQLVEQLSGDADA